MSHERLQAIREFSDKLADYVRRYQAHDLLIELLTENSAGEFRNALLKALRDEWEHKGLLFSLDDYLRAFPIEEGSETADWRLTRALFSIRLIERLHELGVKPISAPEHFFGVEVEEECC
jgi:hypothetical protein